MFCCLTHLIKYQARKHSTVSKTLAHKSLLPNTLCSDLSSGDVDDWDRLEVRPGHAGVQNVLYLNDEEEEEEDGEEVEQGQEGRKVTVRKLINTTQLC